MDFLEDLDENRMNIRLFDQGSLLFLSGLVLSQVAYYLPSIYMLRYLSFFLIIAGILPLFVNMYLDLKQETKSYIFSLSLIVFLLILYFIQRAELHRFDLFIADASDYYLAGVNAVNNYEDIGFFLPLTSAVSAVGFSIFSYEYGPLIIVIIYSLAIPLGYFIFRKLGLNPVLSFLMTLFLVSAPLGIWFSKSTYSEAIWQIQLLFTVVLSYLILDKEKISILVYISLCLLLIVAAFTRGEASLLYVVIIFLALYHFWKFSNLKSALMISSSLLFLAVAIHYAVGLRAHYLLKWQYSRIVSDINETQLMSILYGIAFFVFVLMFFINKFKKAYTQINLPLILTVLAILLKVSIAYAYNVKKTAIAHTLLFKNALGFENFLIMNELGFAYDNFGLLIIAFMAIGLILLHFKAMKGDTVSLILVIMYAIFTLPFVMQSANSKDIHEIFMYWGRYYFALIMLVHIFSFSLLVKLAYDSVSKFSDNIIYRYFLVFVTFAILVLFSMDSKIYNIVTKEAYLTNSQKLMPWVSSIVGKQAIAVVYDDEIIYKLHHNREYDAKILVYRSFPVAQIYVDSYQKVSKDDLDKNLEFMPDISGSKFLLCLSAEVCNLERETLTFVEDIMLPVSWREHYGIDYSDKKIHAGVLSKSIQNSFNLHATLYKIKKDYNIKTIISFKNPSDQDFVLFPKGWDRLVEGKGILSSGSSSRLILSDEIIEKKLNYILVLKISTKATTEIRTLRFKVNGKIIKEAKVNSSRPKEYFLNVKGKFLAKNTQEITIDIENLGNEKSTIILESIKVSKSN